MASLFAYNGRACTTESRLVTKKGTLPRTFIYSFSHPFQPPSLFLNLTLSKYAAMSKNTTISKQQFILTLSGIRLMVCKLQLNPGLASFSLTSFFFLAGYSSVKWTIGTFFIFLVLPK